MLALTGGLQQYRAQQPIKRTKHFELGQEKKAKNQVRRSLCAWRHLVTRITIGGRLLIPE